VYMASVYRLLEFVRCMPCFLMVGGFYSEIALRKCVSHSFLAIETDLAVC